MISSNFIEKIGSEKKDEIQDAILYIINSNENYDVEELDLLISIIEPHLQSPFMMVRSSSLTAINKLIAIKKANKNIPMAGSKLNQIPPEHSNKKAEPQIITTVLSPKNFASLELIKKGREEADNLIKDFSSMHFKEEILPIDSSNFAALVKDMVFWGVTMLGITPLFIVTLTDIQAQMTLFALFFALVWGVIFKLYILRDHSSWKLPLFSLFFTGIAGIWLLLFIYKHALPEGYLELSRSKNFLASLAGFVFQVGLWEELLKALPLLILLFWKRASLNPNQLITMGVFSGLGFAAFENLHYGERAIVSSYALTSLYGAEGLASGVQNAMILVMLRAVSLVFCHGVWSGIVGYFVAAAMVRQRRLIAFILLGLGISSILHGVYNWFAEIQPTVAAAIAGLSFCLFYGYLSKFKSMVKNLS